MLFSLACSSIKLTVNCLDPRALMTRITGVITACPPGNVGTFARAGSPVFIKVVKKVGGIARPAGNAAPDGSTPLMASAVNFEIRFFSK
jgi:hypothetical protein